MSLRFLSIITAIMLACSCIFAEIIEVGNIDTPGDATDVVVRGDYAYIADGPSGLGIVNISNPEEPENTGSLDTDGSTLALAVEGDLAYLADGMRGLVIVDISNPEEPEAIGEFSVGMSIINDVAVSGDYAYLTDLMNGMRIIDVSDPENPEQVSLYDTPDVPQGIFIEGDFAYIADRRSGLQIVDISNPEEPDSVGSYNTRGDAKAVVVEDDLAFVADGDRGIVIILIRRPDQLFRQGTFNTPGIANDVSVSGYFAFVADDGSGLQVIDFSDNMRLNHVFELDTEGMSNGVTFADGFVYIADGESGLRIIQLTPEIVISDEELDFGIVSVDETEELTLTITNEGHADLTISDIVLEAHHYFCVEYEFDEEITIELDESFDFTITFAPEGIGEFEGIITIRSNDPDNEETVVQIEGMSPPEIRFLGRYNTPGSAMGVTVSGDYAFVADYGSGLQIIEISDPESPNRVGQYDTPGSAYGVTVSGDYAYVADYTSGLQIIDISDPESPNRVGQYDTPGYALGVAVSSDYAYVADYGSGLQIIEISDPESPNRVDFYDTDGSAWDVFINGEVAYVADGDNGLLTFDISDFVTHLPHIEVEPDRLDFDEIDVDERDQMTLTISNRGRANLIVSDIVIEGNPFSSDFEEEKIIGPDESSDVTVTFAPEEGGNFEGTMTIISNDPNFEEVVVDLTGTGIQALTVPFTEGWNLISINVSPGQEFYTEGEDRGPEPIRMMEQLRIDEDNHHVILMKDELGRFYLPDYGYCNINYWNLTEGMQVKVDADCEATWAGEQIPFDTDIPISEGWNIIAYYPTFELDASDPDFYVLSPIIDHVIIAKDIQGRFINPEWGYSNMPPWRQTQGYKIKVDEDVTLNYPEQQEERLACASSTPPYPPLETRGGDQMVHAVTLPLETRAGDHMVHTDKNMSLLVNSISGIESESDLRIQAFNSDGLEVGFGTIDEKGQCGLAIWGDDESTDIVEGLREGEAFELKLVSASSETPLSVQTIKAGNGLVYTTNDFTVLEMSASSAIPEDYLLSQNYPNPFNSITRLNYGLPEAGLVNISVFDIEGRLVETLVCLDQVAGYHYVTWDANIASSGLYFIEMKAKGFTQVQKIVLTK